MRKFIGAYWNAASFEKLQKATCLPGASAIEENEGPGGGKVVRVKDPHSFIVGFLHGQAMRTPEIEALSSHSLSNTVLENPWKGSTRRFKLGPSPVHKLAHYGIRVPKARYKEKMNWYMDVLNLKPTDAIFDPKTGEEITCFAHIDLGPQ
jgi:hypothetical protein